MNQQRSSRWQFVLAVALAMSGFVATVAQAVPLTYVLLPGSTIAPVEGATPIGPTEALTGTFQFVPLPVNDQGFDAVALFFSSRSFSITLNQTTLNDLATFVPLNSSISNFAEVVDLVGLGINVGALTGGGTYTGPSEAPILLSYPALTITPHNGGLFAAKLSFTAISVPEPPVWVLLIGLFATMFVLCFVGKSKTRWSTSESAQRFRV
jgi:hypothetical protein